MEDGVGKGWRIEGVGLLDWRVVVQGKGIDLEDIGGGATGLVGQWVDL